MAVETITQSIKVAFRLNNGTTATGAIKTIGISLPTLNKDAFEAEKVFNIEKALYPMLEKSLVRIEKSEISRIQESF